MSHTLQLDIPDSVYEILTRTAHQVGQPPEVIATQWLIAAVQQLADDPLERFIGAFDSQGSDWADQHDRYLGSAARDRMLRTEPTDRSDD